MNAWRCDNCGGPNPEGDVCGWCATPRIPKEEDRENDWRASQQQAALAFSEDLVPPRATHTLLAIALVECEFYDLWIPADDARDWRIHELSARRTVFLPPCGMERLPAKLFANGVIPRLLFGPVPMRIGEQVLLKVVNVSGITRIFNGVLRGRLRPEGESPSKGQSGATSSPCAVDHGPRRNRAADAPREA